MENIQIYRKHLESHIALEAFNCTFCYKKYKGDVFTPDFLIKNSLPKEIITCNTCLSILELSLKLGKMSGFNIKHIKHLEDWYK